MSPFLDGVEIKFQSMSDPYGTALAARQREEILQLVPNLPPFATDFPVFMVLVKDGEPIACGGLRPIEGREDSTAEIKRVFVVPEARGQAKGVSDFLVKELEKHAVGQGWTTIWLQTGHTMVQANKFYERHGYRRIPNYGEYVGATDTISFEKVLV